jgi:hypothetical protein
MLLTKKTNVGTLVLDCTANRIFRDFFPFKGDWWDNCIRFTTVLRSLKMKIECLGRIKNRIEPGTEANLLFHVYL